MIEEKFSAPDLISVSGMGQVLTQILKAKPFSFGSQNPGNRLNADGGEVNRDVSVYGFMFEGIVINATAEKRSKGYDVRVQAEGTPEKEALFAEGMPKLSQHFYSSNG